MGRPYNPHARRRDPEKRFSIYIPAHDNDKWIKLRQKYQSQLSPMIRELINQKIDEWLDDEEDFEHSKLVASC